VGYIFQQFNLLPYLSVLDNVLLPCRFLALRRGRAAAAARSAAAGRGPASGASGAGARPVNPSGRATLAGQQQRVAAARALIGRLDMVIAAEPTY
jgi:putative ABC transport system ATP-binding protein